MELPWGPILASRKRILTRQGNKRRPRPLTTNAQTTRRHRFHGPSKTPYPAGSFSWDIPFNQTVALPVFADWKAKNWLDFQTRAIAIEMTVYNPNIDIYSVDRFLIETLPSGMYTTKTSMNTMVMSQYSSLLKVEPWTDILRSENWARVSEIILYTMLLG